MKIYQVDSFTSEKFKGNPAGVCLLESPVEEEWMQNIAMEMNLSETAFLFPNGDQFDLRWFTPKIEVDLCGHATLASAHILWEEKILSPDQTAKFQTKTGLLKAEKKGNFIEMDFPVTPILEDENPKGLAKALGTDFIFSGKNRYDFLVEVDSEETLFNLNPDMNLLREIPCRGFIVTAISDNEPFDFVCRFFAPGAGIDEDPVTGSAYCTLGPYWKSKLDQNSFTAFQASKRGGVVKVEVEKERVKIIGQAITVFRGDLV